jgi:hypothetical protein
MRFRTGEKRFTGQHCSASIPYDCDLKTPSRVSCDVCQHGRQLLTTDVMLIKCTRVPSRKKKSASQHCSRDVTEHCCLINDDSDHTLGTTYVARLHSLQLTHVGLAISERHHDRESTNVCPLDGATTRKEEFYEACMLKYDWKLAVDPFVVLHKLMWLIARLWGKIQFQWPARSLYSSARELKILLKIFDKCKCIQGRRWMCACEKVKRIVGIKYS